LSPARLSVAVVTFEPDLDLLERCLRSLAVSVRMARERGLVSAASLFVVDNDEVTPADLPGVAVEAFGDAGRVELIHGHGNVGYGRANNLAIARLESDLHLVMNPDVELEPAALAAAVAAREADPKVGAVAPQVRGPGGEMQYLCKRYPSVWVLFLRGFAPRALRSLNSRALEAYEMRDLPDDRTYSPVPLASGCFMLMRTELFRRVGGFDPRFFMYFEDYDLSLRFGREAALAYVPAARIVHHGGEASRKGMHHIAWFLRSAWRFFSTHGWKIA
jgi:hypothetical protein